MTTTIDYGNLTKRVIFVDNDHRHAQLLLKLKYDGIKQADFFRHIVSGYIDDDSRITEYIEEFKTQSLKHKEKSKRLRKAGKKQLNNLNLGSDEIENIFDIIEEGHPDL